MSDDIKKDDLEMGGCGCSTNQGCGCGHDHDHDHHHHYETITLTMEGDEEVECAVLGIFDHEDQEYIALLPENSDDVYIYIYNETEDGEVELENIESQELFDQVSAIFMEIVESEEDEEDEE